MSLRLMPRSLREPAETVLQFFLQLVRGRTLVDESHFDQERVSFSVPVLSAVEVLSKCQYDETLKRQRPSSGG